MRILVLGGYGLIGSHVVRRLAAAGHDVLGLGRDVTAAARRMPDIGWITADIAELVTDEAWRPLLAQIGPEAIVNCAGALQDGARDDLAALQSRAMCALYRAAPACGVRLLVQISAPRAAPGADTAFMRTKGEADAALAASALAWTVLRPGLVIAPDAYGGTALIRALASVPLVQPLAFAEARIQTVGVEEVADAVVRAVAGEVPAGRTYDLVEDEAHSLADIVRAFRGWLGLPVAREVRVPTPFVRAAARVADALGWLGWRSPLRTTALEEIAAGVTGDPAPWRAVTGASLAPLAKTLAGLPSTVQERWFARLFLLQAAAIGMLALFWVVTGIITLLDPAAAARTLITRGTPEVAARVATIGGALADVALGMAILWRPAVTRAALGMIAMTLLYLLGATWLAPDLWLDPLGPLVKPLPALVLAGVVLALAGDR